MKKRKDKTAKELSIEKSIVKATMPFRANDRERRFVRVTHYMLMHDNFKSLSGNAVKAYLYIFDWATNNQDFWDNDGVFEFAGSLLHPIMSQMTAKNCLKELVDKGFLDCEYKKARTYINRYSLSSRWYDGEKHTPVISDYKSIIETPCQ